MPTAADIRIKNAAVQAKNGVRQPPKKPVSEKRAEASADRTASSVKYAALVLVFLLGGGLIIQILQLFFSLF